MPYLFLQKVYIYIYIYIFILRFAIGTAKKKKKKKKKFFTNYFIFMFKNLLSLTVIVRQTFCKYFPDVHSLISVHYIGTDYLSNSSNDQMTISVFN